MKGGMTSSPSLLGAITMGRIIVPASKGCWENEVSLNEKCLTCNRCIYVSCYCVSHYYFYCEALLGGCHASRLRTWALWTVELET